MLRRKPNLILFLAAMCAVVIGAWLERSDGATHKASLAQLVPDATERAQLVATLDLIDRGGPFPYKQDGTTFGNREKRLPLKARDYYREYTVPTPGAKNRGARRVIRGRGGETYYTRDHYRMFMRIDS